MNRYPALEDHVVWNDPEGRVLARGRIHDIDTVGDVAEVRIPFGPAHFLHVADLVYLEGTTWRATKAGRDSPSRMGRPL